MGKSNSDSQKERWFIPHIWGFQGLNKCIQSDKYPLPGLDDLLARLGTANRYFSKIDLEAAYHQIPLAVYTRSLTTVITHIGTYKFTRMSFRIKSALSAFQRIMTELIGDCVVTLVNLDGILIAAPDRIELGEKGRTVRGKLHEVGIKINERKSVDCSTRITWLGFEITDIGIRLTVERQRKLQP